QYQPQHLLAGLLAAELRRHLRRQPRDLAGARRGPHLRRERQSPVAGQHALRRFFAGPGQPTEPARQLVADGWRHGTPTETKMQPFARVLAMLILAGAACTSALAGGPDAPNPAPEAIARSQFLPNRKHQALPGKAVGVLALGDKGLLAAEGRKGPDDVL